MPNPLYDKEQVKQILDLKWNLTCEKVSLKKGAKNDTVKTLQKYLKYKTYYTREIDGDFGKYTEEAVKKFQQENKLKDDGWFGPESCKKATKLIKKEKKDAKNMNSSLKRIRKHISKKSYSSDEERMETFLILYDSYVILPEGTETEETEETSDETTENAESTTDTSTDTGSTDTSNTNASSTTATSTDMTTSGTGDTSTDTSSTGTSSTETKTETTTPQTDLTTLTPKIIHEKDDKLKERLYTEFISKSSSDDTEDLSHEATVKLIYTNKRYNEFIKLRTCEYLAYLRGKRQIRVQGFISSVKRTQENGLPLIEVGITGYQAFLEQECNINATAKKSELLDALCKMAGLKLDLDLTYLIDDTYTLSSSSSSSSSNSNTTGGTPDESKLIEIGNMLASKYKFCSGACQAYSCMKTSGCGSCFAWSGALYTELKAVGFTVRVVEYATSQAGNHRSVEYQKNGQWVDYPYRSTSIPKNARNTSNRNRTVVLDENGKGVTNIL